MWITSEWNCFRVMSGRSVAPAADWKRRRFCKTFSRVSQSVKPRFRTFSFSREEMPPGLVEDAWISQGSLEKAGIWRSWRPREVRVVQNLDERRFAPVCFREDFTTGISSSV